MRRRFAVRVYPPRGHRGNGLSICPHIYLNEADAFSKEAEKETMAEYTEHLQVECLMCEEIINVAILVN